MKLWRADYRDDNAGTGIVSVWTTSKRALDAELARVRAQQPEGFEIYRTEAVDVPTKREALAAFLNRHAANR